MMTRIDQEPVTILKPLCPRSFTPQHHNVPDPLYGPYAVSLCLLSGVVGTFLNTVLVVQDGLTEWGNPPFSDLKKNK